MFTSFSEFKFFQSFRIPVESRDDVRCLIQYEDELGKYQYISDAKLADVSVTGMGFITQSRISVGTNLRISLQFKRIFLDLSADVVRAFSSGPDDVNLMYGAELDEEDSAKMKRFIEQYIASFSPERARDCLISLSLSERYKSATEGFEIFSLMLSLFKDITQFGNQDGFVDTMLEEITRILNAQRASIFLINPETNELEAIAALGTDKNLLKFDYRKGIAGSVFTTGVALNIDCKTDKIRFSEEIDSKTGFETKSIICHPISNREDKIIGVIEILNKRNEDRFTVEDEKTMKVLALIFSSVFHNYNPISEKSLIRRFSTPYDREFAWIGHSPETNEARRAIVKLKDVDSPLLIEGEVGVGKKLLGRIIHQEGKRGLNPFELVRCSGVDEKDLTAEVFGSETVKSKLEVCIGGTVVFENIEDMPLTLQKKLVNVLKSKRIEGSKISLDVRAIFTSSKDLRAATYEEKTFNPDLYEYISMTIINIPPLRKRHEDIDDLLNYFLKRECRKQGLLLKEFSDEVKSTLISYDWPMNVNEVQKVVEKAVLYNPKTHIISDIVNKIAPIIDTSKQSMNALDAIPYAKDYSIALKDRITLVEREMIMAEIKRMKGNKSKAAKEMGISREALRKKLIMADEVLASIQGKSPSSDSQVIELNSESDHDQDKKAA
jgi:two-component system response regulator HydG